MCMNKRSSKVIVIYIREQSNTELNESKRKNLINKNSRRQYSLESQLQIYV